MIAAVLIALSTFLLYVGQWTGLAVGFVGSAIIVADAKGIGFVYVSYTLIALGGAILTVHGLADASALSVASGLIVVLLATWESYRHRRAQKRIDL